MQFYQLQVELEKGPLTLIENALVCPPGVLRSCILNSLQTFYHKLYMDKL